MFLQKRSVSFAMVVIGHICAQIIRPLKCDYTISKNINFVKSAGRTTRTNAFSLTAIVGGPTVLPGVNTILLFVPMFLILLHVRPRPLTSQESKNYKRNFHPPKVSYSITVIYWSKFREWKSIVNIVWTILQTIFENELLNARTWEDLFAVTLLFIGPRILRSWTGKSKI